MSRKLINAKVCLSVKRHISLYILLFNKFNKVKVGNDQEIAQSE